MPCCWRTTGRRSSSEAICVQWGSSRVKQALQCHTKARRTNVKGKRELRALDEHGILTHNDRKYFFLDSAFVKLLTVKSCCCSARRSSCASGPRTNKGRGELIETKESRHVLQLFFYSGDSKHGWSTCKIHSHLCVAGVPEGQRFLYRLLQGLYYPSPV